MFEIYMAEETATAIDTALEEDQGATYRRLLAQYMPLMTDAYDDSERTRGYLGASSAGKDCLRALWYSFRWAHKQRHSARLLRLFNRGHLEEARILALLAMIGVKIEREKSQAGFKNFEGHYCGNVDGIITGVPDAPDTRLLLEVKTHSRSNFGKLKNGVRRAFPMHYRQMQLYMQGMHLPGALYVGVNKDDDSLHLELLKYDEVTAAQYFDRAGKVIGSLYVPERVHESPGWHQCLICDYHEICHKNAPADKTCRICSWVQPTAEGTWSCSNPKGKYGPLSVEDQRAACSEFSPLITVAEEETTGYDNSSIATNEE